MNVDLRLEEGKLKLIKQNLKGYNLQKGLKDQIFLTILNRGSGCVSHPRDNSQTLIMVLVSHC